MSSVNFLYDGSQLICELDGTGAVTATNTWGDGLLSRRVAAASVFYTFDPSGNIAQRLDGAGNVLGAYAFDAFGLRTGTDNTTDPYAGFGGGYGYYADAETGLSLLGHRYYDAGTGRFINRDPIGYDGGINLYAYAENNPDNDADPSGFMPGLALAGGGVIVTGTAGGEGLAALGAASWPVALGAAVLATGYGLGTGATWVGNHIANGFHPQAGLPAPYYATKAPLPPIITERDPTKNPLAGKDPADVVPGKDLPPDWITEPGREPGTVRYRPPGYQGPQVLKEPGDPNATGSDPVHRGPYCKISPGNGKPFRIPLRGNPLNGPGF